jgi:leucyl/phenylalanyl-tRNA--protein transferase
MFSREADASKAALAGLVQRCEALGIELIDCQLPSAHLRSLGSRPIPRREFLAVLAPAVTGSAS